MKIIQRSKFKTWSQTEYKGLSVNEMQILKSMDHKNIVKLHEIIDDPLKNKIYLVMDYLPGGTLLDKLKKTGSGLP